MSGCDDFAFWDMKSISHEDFTEAWLLYLAELTRMCELGHADILAHITYPIRYYNQVGRTFDVAPYKDELATLLTTAIDHGMLLEVNTSGYRQGMGGPLPEASVISLYKDLGGRLISIGSDAHHPDDIGANFKETEALLKSLTGTSLYPGKLYHSFPF